MNDFEFAKVALRQKKMVRRDEWPKGDYLVIKHESRSNFLYRWSAKFATFTPATFRWDEITAMNWEVVAIA